MTYKIKTINLPEIVQTIHLKTSVKPFFDLFEDFLIYS